VDAIVAEDLYKRYKDVQALDGLSFSVRDGEVFGLLGPNEARSLHRRHREPGPEPF
jgi:ABC-type multidrug transport system ATPase subunit